jgi:hypothetical protein
MRASGGKLQLPLPTAIAALAVCVAAALGAPSSAAASGPLEYTLKVTEGVTTVPENSVAYTSAHANHKTQMRLNLVHNGVLTYTDPTSHGEWVGFPQVPVPGDVLTLESPFGTVVGSVAYDGLPSMDASVCAGSRNFSGQRSGAESVQGRYYTEAPVLDRYGHPIPGQWQHVNEGFAQVTALAGSAFGGSFLAPLALGETVVATESIEEPLGGGAVFTYESETVRPVGACPVPPPPPPPPPAPLIPALRASIAKVMFPRLSALRRKGLHDQVLVNQRAFVVQDLFLAGGALPAHASRRAHRPPPAVLLARGTAASGGAGSVTVTLRPTAKGWSRMRNARNLSVVLLTTVHNASGSSITLPARRLKLHH